MVYSIVNRTIQDHLEVVRALNEQNEALLKNLSSTQSRCSELLLEVRELRRSAAMASHCADKVHCFGCTCRST